VTFPAVTFQDTLSLLRITPAPPVVPPKNVMTQAYVITIAETAMTMRRSVARIGEIAFLEWDILLGKCASTSSLDFELNLFNLYEVRICIRSVVKST